MSALETAEGNVREQLLTQGIGEDILNIVIGLFRKEYGDNAWTEYHAIENDIIFEYKRKVLKVFPVNIVLHVRDISLIKDIITRIAGPEV